MTFARYSKGCDGSFAHEDRSNERDGRNHERSGRNLRAISRITLCATEALPPILPRLQAA